MVEEPKLIPGGPEPSPDSRYFTPYFTIYFALLFFLTFIFGFPECPIKPKNPKIVKREKKVKMRDSAAKNILQNILQNILRSIIRSIILYTGNAFQIDIYIFR
jgi:hypothetical protein